MTVPTRAGMRSRLDTTSSEVKEYRTRLIVCLQQSVPDYETKPEKYTPPELGSTKDTLPANFAYRPATRGLTELEAMNLFLLRLHELDGLDRRLQPDGLDMDHPKADCSIGPILYSGQTLNYEDVQQRAMDCHGGFESHNEMILQKAKKAVDEWKYGQWKPFPEELLARFALSPGRLKYKDWAKDVQDKSLLAVWWPPYDQNMDDLGAPELYALGIGSD
ncbi:uncharacterized protein EV420DRAFT_226051 [Desarmillaria tabescens]|uniref:Uncharacterized protein n=1 Tax=Armillaria tabescens TaxID=1929756 RepID=A0AA39T2W9_ARMTA|nr:uncharacterized protein EV420DRAFT_226051 [Desarmillaria tabescens]KAK0460691.1 hypothetical protein EV420DRAFT_226051 [Desarmillaria tabescens]